MRERVRAATRGADAGLRHVHRHLKAIDSPTSPPIPLKSNDVKDNISAPHSSGIAPPIVEPIKIATQIKTREGITTPCVMFKHEGRGRGNGARRGALLRYSLASPLSRATRS